MGETPATLLKPGETKDGKPRTGLRCWRGALLLVGLGLALYLPGLKWGLPATVSWSQDTIAGVRTLGAVEAWPQTWVGRYPPLQYLILAAAYQPVLNHWERSGERIVDPATGRTVLRPPHAPKISLLILIGRAATVVMAIGAGLGLWSAARVLTGDEAASVLAAVALMIGAAFTYFAHLGNVDIPSVFWFTWSVFFFARLLRSGRWSDAVLLGLLGSFAISTKDAVGGMYAGLALALIVEDARRTLKAHPLGVALCRSLFQMKWLLGVVAFVLPYLLLYGVFSDPESYRDRMNYWLDPTAGSLHARQLRYPNQLQLLLATVRYAAAAVGWPMVAAMSVAVVHCLRRHRRVALVVLASVLGYYVIVIMRIDFVYSRFLFAPLAMLAVLVGLAGADLWRCCTLPGEIRLGIPAVVLLLSLGYALAVNVEMLTDSRVRAEHWFKQNVDPVASVGAFSSPQYLPRFNEMGFNTYKVQMTRESFDRPQPDYLVMSSYNYEDFDGTQEACRRELVAGRLGYSPVAGFGPRYLGTGSSWLSVAGWGTPVPGKISPVIIIMQRNQDSLAE